MSARGSKALEPVPLRPPLRSRRGAKEDEELDDPPWQLELPPYDPLNNKSGKKSAMLLLK